MTQDRWDGQKYRENSDSQERFALMGVDRLALQGHERVLDVGCGDGRVTAEIARRVPRGRVLGIDASASMIEACTESHRDQANLAFQVADATAFRVDDPFDAAVSFSALHWVADLPAAVARIHAALKPGGALLIGMGGAQHGAIAEVFRRERWRQAMTGRPRTFHGRAREELDAILKDGGFIQVDVRAIEGERIYPSEQALLDWIMAWLPHASGLAGDAALELGQEIVAAVARPGQGEIAWRSTLLVARATRG